MSGPCDLQAMVEATPLLSFIFRRVLEDSPVRINLGRALWPPSRSSSALLEMCDASEKIMA